MGTVNPGRSLLQPCDVPKAMASPSRSRKATPSPTARKMTSDTLFSQPLGSSGLHPVRSHLPAVDNARASAQNPACTLAGTPRLPHALSSALRSPPEGEFHSTYPPATAHSGGPRGFFSRCADSVAASSHGSAGGSTENLVEVSVGVPSAPEFTEDKARILRQRMRELENYHDTMYHSGLASRLA